MKTSTLLTKAMVEEYILEKGVQPQLTVFFGYKSPFSNFHSCSFVDENDNRFSSNEQYVMFRKAVLFGDDFTAKELLKPNLAPIACKALGRSVKGFVPEIWGAEKCQIMKAGLYFKFSQNPNLLSALLKTKPSVMVEASPYDQVWGAGVSADRARNVDCWTGENLLGFCLMDVRDALNEQN